MKKPEVHEHPAVFVHPDSAYCCCGWEWSYEKYQLGGYSEGRNPHDKRLDAQGVQNLTQMMADNHIELVHGMTAKEASDALLDHVERGVKKL